tara:strand:- start:783 stop:944 length:162 start_codon:yes stop_codon:yes gene_type:complete
MVRLVPVWASKHPMKTPVMASIMIVMASQTKTLMANVLLGKCVSVVPAECREI